MPNMQPELGKAVGRGYRARQQQGQGQVARLVDIRAAAGPQRPTRVHWSPEARDAVQYPALTPYLWDTAETAARADLRHRIMQEYVLASLLYRPEVFRHVDP